jgi:hypothetical protein
MGDESFKLQSHFFTTLFFVKLLPNVLRLGTLFSWLHFDDGDKCQTRMKSVHFYPIGFYFSYLLIISSQADGKLSTCFNIPWKLLLLHYLPAFKFTYILGKPHSILENNIFTFLVILVPCNRQCSHKMTRS